MLILNDKVFGFIKWERRAKGFKSFGLDYRNPDFAKYAESFGAVGVKVRKGDDLTKVLQDAFALKKLVVIECPVDYSDNLEMFSKKLNDLVCEG